MKKKTNKLTEEEKIHNEKMRELRKKLVEESDRHDTLLQNIKKNMPELEKLLKEVNDHWGYEDRVYRFYHHSFKVYEVQGLTEKIVNTLRKLHWDKQGQLDKDFETIYLEGTCRNRVWQHSHNLIWLTATRPFLEAFFHAKYFLEMAVKYGKELKEAPQMLPSGWGTLLCLYGLR